MIPVPLTLRAKRQIPRPPLDLPALHGYSLAAAADQAIAGDLERSGPREESPSSTGQGAG
jgi:hypothetical protein